MKKIIALLIIIAVLLIPNFAIAQGEEAPITRGEFARIVWQLFEVDGELPTSPTRFVDIADNWAEGYISYLYVHRLVVGDGDASRRTFRPDDEILVEEAITILVRALGGPSPDWAGFLGVAYPSSYIWLARWHQELIDDIDIPLGGAAGRAFVSDLINRSLDMSVAPILNDDYYDFSDITIRDWVWNGGNVYFDGTNWIMPEGNGANIIEETAPTINYYQLVGTWKAFFQHVGLQFEFNEDGNGNFILWAGDIPQVIAENIPFNWEIERRHGQNWLLMPNSDDVGWVPEETHFEIFTRYGQEILILTEILPNLEFRRID
ncbi:MAG: S-layer homology domain-containing protein [Oscillospiraceae bacterium]|nr:S-layer homology domain-containing protein [Oscillospiraceae bacterium]